MTCIMIFEAQALVYTSSRGLIDVKLRDESGRCVVEVRVVGRIGIIKCVWEFKYKD